MNSMSSPVFALEDTSAIIHYTWLRPVFWQSMISNHQLMTRATRSSSQPSSLVDWDRKTDHDMNIGIWRLTLILICILSFPAPFKCIIKPRAPAAEALIRGSVYEELWKDRAELPLYFRQILLSQINCSSHQLSLRVCESKENILFMFSEHYSSKHFCGT